MSPAKPARGSDGNLAPRRRASQENSQQMCGQRLLAVHAQVQFGHAQPRRLVVGFEVQDDVVFAATGGVVPRPGIAFSLFEKHWNVSGGESRLE